MTATVVHLVPHTHWDREWYEPFQSFRMRLVELVDQLLDQLEADDRFCFTLDGQLATIDDYLEIRPEAEERIRALVREGRLAVGPWQILMDEFLPSGETIVRNLEMGRRRALELGGVMDVGYLPDMFGHIAQMPQILRRAGIEDAVVWRGVPGAIDRNAFRWVAPDGSAVRAEYLVGGYGNAAHLFAIPDRLPRQLESFHELQRPFYGDRALLAMYGYDHAVPSPDLTRFVDDGNRASDRHEVRIATLPGYLVASRAADEDEAALPSWAGELRSSARANILMGVTSARVDLKKACARAERWLERYAEPLQALFARTWPAALLDLAWRKVVDDSAHDSICGCSLDPVVDQVLTRYAEAEQIARGLATRALGAVASRVPRDRWVAVNPTPAERSGLIELYAPVPESWPEVALELPDGRVLATQERGRNTPLLYRTQLPGSEVPAFLHRRLHGRELFGHRLNAFRLERVGGAPELSLLVDDDEDPVWLDVDELRREIEAAVLAAPEETWRVMIVAEPRRTLRAMVPAPPLGWTALRAVPGPGEIEAPVSVDHGRLWNGLVDVRVTEEGLLRIERDGVVLQGVGRLVDGGDYGDSYNYGPPRDDRLVERPVDVLLETSSTGPVEGELRVTRTYEWPLGLLPDGSGRTDATARIPVAMTVALRAGEPFVRIRLELENRATDHRLRFHVPLGAAASRSYAEGGFAIVERARETEAGYGEVPLPTFPARGWLDAGGCAVLLDHVMEYELTGNELALTLLRATGLISRNDNPFREDPAGPQKAIPNAQCRRDWEVSFALYPHRGDWREGDVIGVAERFQHTFLSGPGAQELSGAADEGRALPLSAAGLEVAGTGAVFSSLRRRDGWLELRLVAQHHEPTRAVVRGDLGEAREADLLGRPGADLAVSAGTVTLDLHPWEIRTIQLR